MPANDPANDGDYNTTNPIIVIPYFNGDEGLIGTQRPLTMVAPPVIPWLCPAIKVQGVGYTSPPGRYLPDQPLAISVMVDNRGVPGTLVNVNVYWAAPSTGFTTPTLILSSTFPVSGRSVLGPTQSPKMIWTPEHTKIPPHFCLLVNAMSYSELDPGPSAADAMNDGHWACYNLQSATMPASKNLSSVFWAANPELESAAFTITARPVSEAGLRMIARMVKAEPVSIKSEQLALRRAAVEANTRASRQASVVLELKRGERQPLVVSAHSLDLASHQFTAIEVVQTRLGAEREKGAMTGSLGIVLFAADKRVSATYSSYKKFGVRDVAEW